MNKVFFGTFICHAKNELAPINSLLTRASNKFLTEKSIDEAIVHLQRSADHLLKAKKLYSESKVYDHIPHNFQPNSTNTRIHTF